MANKDAKGQPVKPINWDLLEKMCQYKVTLKDCADLLDCSERTIQKRVLEYHGCTFYEYREKKMMKTRLTLQQKAIRMALDGNTTMMIFALKNLCGWSDKQEIEVSEKKNPLVIQYEQSE